MNLSEYSNLDGLALRLSHHVVPPFASRKRQKNRSIEVNAVMFNGVDDLPPSNVPAGPKISSEADPVYQPSSANNRRAGRSTSWSSV